MGRTTRIEKQEFVNELLKKYDVKYCYTIEGIQYPLIAYLVFDKHTDLSTVTCEQLVINRLQFIYPTIKFNVEYIIGKIQQGNELVFPKFIEIVVRKRKRKTAKKLAEIEQQQQQKAEAEKEREVKAAIDLKYFKEKDKWKKLNRNELCLCGSKKKFKQCCISTWEEKLTKKNKKEYVATT